MKKLAAALAALCLTALPVLAQDQETEDQVTTFTLDNGLEVVVIEDHRAPVVSHMVWYRAGSADETPGSSGVAHFLEHLLFKGTDTLDPGEFSKIVAQNGGTDNAFTSYDQTAYYQRVAADRLGLMMEMEADRMVNLRLDEEDILTERDVIIEERNMRVENDPSALMREQLGATLYLNHRYGIPIIGWRDEMETLDLDAAYDFYHRFYAPNNAILIVAGDVTPDEVKALAEEHYGPLEANPEVGAPRARPQEPEQTAERRLIFRDPRVAQPYVMRRYLAPERDPGDQREAAALTLLDQVLGGGQTSVLTRELQFDRKVAVYTGAFYDGTSYDDSSFGLVVVPSTGVSLEEAEAALDETLADFIETGVDPEQLERIKFQLRADRIYARDNVQSLSRRYGSALTSGLTVEDVQAWPEVLQSITPEEIVEAAKKVFDRKQSVTGYLMAEETATPMKEVTQ
ncbi:MAG: insulinase family protein [Rhodobacteraceae bacterium]|jgi:zinc protease|uniref:Zinc protease n=1 Tax=Salipiger profundus TaxID=1229727 RepID=A0A1U7D036_9RHOB|nr:MULTISPECIES: pitrilysin family protein [Salipiger]APX21445.1 zinc protease [Salipiger profundus]MAB08853.1 insulinase family protein [Paracoccaceae bacterium]GGA02330.1 peptidase M16 [Salipiger profundus]SFC20528.1 zinc protease [Salipiger profundus]